MSDIHGFGNVYYAMMNYLDNLSKEEEIELYINGDLCDRGSESAEILLDVMARMQNNNYKIIYLGGNHELMMYDVFEKRRRGRNTYFNDWYGNGGKVTDDGLIKRLKDKEKVLKVADFIGNLKIYHLFPETIDSKRILLVHAASPFRVKDECEMRIKDNNLSIFYAVWAREDDLVAPFKCPIGNKHYFSIVGHTANHNPFGYVYHAKGNYLNIDGGCAMYVSGLHEFNHFPLVEIKDNALKILTFNSNNEIIAGHYFIDKKSIAISDNELEEDRKYLSCYFKIKRR